jgi:hypothetical protein
MNSPCGVASFCCVGGCDVLAVEGEGEEKDAPRLGYLSLNIWQQVLGISFDLGILGLPDIMYFQVYLFSGTISPSEKKV